MSDIPSIPNHTTKRPEPVRPVRRRDAPDDDNRAPREDDTGDESAEDEEKRESAAGDAPADDDADPASGHGPDEPGQIIDLEA